VEALGFSASMLLTRNPLLLDSVVRGKNDVVPRKVPNTNCLSIVPVVYETLKPPRFNVPSYRGTSVMVIPEVEVAYVLPHLLIPLRENYRHL